MSIRATSKARIALRSPVRRFGIRLDDYPRVLSGGGGQHIYMAKPSELRIVGKLSEFPGIEFKTKGTLLVAAGSVTSQFTQAL